MKKLMLSLFLISMISCSKSKNDELPLQVTLPPITTEGLNTSGCVINGKIIIPKDGINGISGGIIKGLQVDSGSNFYSPLLGNDFFSFKITNLKDEKGKSYWIYVHVNNLTNGVGEYILEQSNGDFYNQSSNNPQIIVRETNNGVSGNTYLSSNNSGKIIITKFNSSICSGTFTATLSNMNDTSDKIQVTEGRFDIKIQ
jgi:hypothetical protein